MRSLILAAAVLTIAGPALADPIQPEKCRDESARAAAPGVAKPRRLGDMPAGTQLKAVRNLVDGCPKPIVVRQEVGQAPPRR